jgi:hypothetical protein
MISSQFIPTQPSSAAISNVPDIRMVSARQQNEMSTKARMQNLFVVQTHHASSSLVVLPAKVAYSNTIGDTILPPKR